MKKIILLIILSFAVLSSAFSADVLTYTGAGSEIPSSNLSLTFEIDSKQALRESQDSSATVNEYFRYGFYTTQDNVEPVTDGSTRTTTLIFKESPKKIDTSEITYSASASFSIYVYILSNSRYKLTLSWTDLAYNSSTTDKISYTIGEITSGTSFYTFDPASGIYVHKDWTFNALTEVYDISTSTSNVVYTGTMTLTMVTS